MSSAILSTALRRSTSTGGTTFRFLSTTIAYANVLSTRPHPSVALITLNRPKALNALSAAHFQDIYNALLEADQEEAVGAMVLTGSEKAFAGKLRAPTSLPYRRLRSLSSVIARTTQRAPTSRR